ncbi:MAG: ATP-binding protein [Selenomonadaceae bacterium]|nr:ATP-binding protein [Selenomonadaceae bacterium]
MSGNYLKSWRNVIEPRDEVAQGRFTQSEFAADLGQVVRGESNNIEYTDADEFFARTYLTSGLKKLLVTTLERLTGNGGDPIIQLKTSFGGGKTHSLLALYHLFGGKLRSVQKPMFREIFDAAKISALPEVHTAVIVGTWENSLKSTLWGEIAKQLAKSTGKPELYELIRENDEQKIAPGVELLRKIFNEAGACLILIDELVAYGRTLSEGKISAGGNFENLLSFIQQLTEAAKTSPKTSLIVSIPESDNEIGGELGWRVQSLVTNIFRRVEFIWSPISTVEGYEIVRRRLFKPCHDEQAREKVCAAFFDMYLNNRQDFPTNIFKTNYKENLLACYPIHPQLFDFLYGKWTGLKNFQKTRGVLRLMAKVVFSLWDNHDMNTLIMPGTIPLDDSSVRDELTNILKEEDGNWDAIVQSEIDGKKSKAYNLDKDNPRFQRLSTARKISRSIFYGHCLRQKRRRRARRHGRRNSSLHDSAAKP